MSVHLSIYGKLPAHADYILINLTSTIEVQLHEWISSTLFDTQAVFEHEDWLKAYLTISPLCFLLNINQRNKHSLFGVMVPSVDRVGRYFPLLAGVYLENQDESKSIDRSLLTSIANVIVEEQVKAMHDYHSVETLHDNIINLKELQSLDKYCLTASTCSSLTSVVKDPIVSSCWWELDNPNQMLETIALPPSNYYQSILSRGLKA